MSVSEFATQRIHKFVQHNLNDQIFYLQNRKKPQKHRKQLILTDSKNILTERFQPIQRLQANFITDGIRNFMTQQKQRKQLLLTDGNIFLLTVSNQYNACDLMYTKHNVDNAKLKIFSFILQRQRIQPNFTNHTYQTINQRNTTRTIQTTASTWISPLTQSLCSYNGGNANSGVFIFKFQSIS